MVQLVAELAPLKKTQLRKRAMENGMGEARVEELDDDLDHLKNVLRSCSRPLIG